ADTELLHGVFARALADDPQERFDSALKFVEALEQALPHNAPATVARSPMARPSLEGRPRSDVRAPSEVRGAADVDMLRIDAKVEDIALPLLIRSAADERDLRLPLEEPELDLRPLRIVAADTADTIDALDRFDEAQGPDHLDEIGEPDEVDEVESGHEAVRSM